MSKSKITFFESEYYMISNWSAHSIIVDGIEYKTVDHAYHSSKFNRKDIKFKIINAQSPFAAKNIANKYLDDQINLTEDGKIQIVYKLNCIKADQHQEVRDALSKSGNLEIVEDSPLDSFWGIGPDGKGRNELGKIWMKIRQNLQADS